MACLRQCIKAALIIISLATTPALASPKTNAVADPLVIDTFRELNTNDLGGWHGADKGLFMEYGPGFLRLMPQNSDMSYHTQVSRTCFDLSLYKDKYIHISFEGTDKFTISLTQNNKACSRQLAPYPETWDSVEAARYVYKGTGGRDIFVPVSHFDINLALASSIEFHGFYTKNPLQLFKVEITSATPADWRAPKKLPTGKLIRSCTRKDSFAFGIDEGNPKFAREVMDILGREGVLVTFFVVGDTLVNRTTGFTEVYKEMARRGHQIAMHSYSHPRMEGLAKTEEIDYQISENIAALKKQVGVETRYFRPPFGNAGARTRQRLATKLKDPYVINWSVDAEDWLWGPSKTPERQVRSFQRDLKKGGNLAALHFTHHSTVEHFQEFFKSVKESGKRIMRIDQCLEDPNAPRL